MYHPFNISESSDRSIEFSLLAAEMLEKRWKGMTETFKDNLNRVKDAKRRSSGNGTEDNYTPKWKLYNSLQFLKKCCDQSSSYTNLPTVSAPSSVVPIASDRDLQQVVKNFAGSVYFDENTQVRF